MENIQYLKYKDRFKLNCILKALSGALAFFAIAFLIFVPNFEINVLGLTLIRFSVLDEIILSFKNVSSGYGVGATSMIFQLLAAVQMAIGLVIYAVSLIKNILNITNTENYALEQYDKIKTRESDGARKNWNRFSVTQFFISGVMLEMLYIIYSKAFSGIFGENYDASYFSQVNTVSWLIIFFIIFTLAYITVAVTARIQLKNLKLEILKEDYGLSQQNFR